MNIISTLKVLIYTLTESFKIINIMKKEGSDKFYDAAKIWSTKLLKKAKVSFKIKSYNYDKNKSYIIVANHSSYLDIPILLSSLDIPFVIMYKRELEKIPLFGEGLRLSPFISVDRSNPRDAVKSLASAVNLLSNNISVLIFPEGTRSVDGNLGEFKKGATRIAYKSKSSILPVRITNSNELMKKDSLFIKQGEVLLDIKEEIKFEDYTNIKEDELLSKLKTILSK
jgi:1-acyl-sn-glycerol-3-phosphate acyltransferase